MTYKSSKYMHLNSFTKAHAHRRRTKKVKRTKPNLPGKVLQQGAKKHRTNMQKQKVQRRLQKGVIRLGDQWASGKLAYRKIRKTIASEFTGRWLAVAQGGIDLIAEEGESREDFEKRVKELVKAHESYSPYIVKHRPHGQPADAENTDDDEEVEEEAEEDEEEAEEGFATPDEGEEEDNRPATVPKGEHWVDVD